MCGKTKKPAALTKGGRLRYNISVSWGPRTQRQHTRNHPIPTSMIGQVHLPSEAPMLDAARLPLPLGLRTPNEGARGGAFPPCNHGSPPLHCLTLPRTPLHFCLFACRQHTYTLSTAITLSWRAFTYPHLAAPTYSHQTHLQLREVLLLQQLAKRGPEARASFSARETHAYGGLVVGVVFFFYPMLPHVI